MSEKELADIDCGCYWEVDEYFRENFINCKEICPCLLKKYYKSKQTLKELLDNDEFVKDLKNYGNIQITSNREVINCCYEQKIVFRDKHGNEMTLGDKENMMVGFISTKIKNKLKKPTLSEYVYGVEGNEVLKNFRHSISVIGKDKFEIEYILLLGNEIHLSDIEGKRIEIDDSNKDLEIIDIRLVHNI